MEDKTTRKGFFVETCDKWGCSELLEGPFETAQHATEYAMKFYAGRHEWDVGDIVIFHGELKVVEVIDCDMVTKISQRSDSC